MLEACICNAIAQRLQCIWNAQDRTGQCITLVLLSPSVRVLSIALLKQQSSNFEWFPFYWNKWLNNLKVRSLTAEERGVYLDMICYCYLNNGAIELEEYVDTIASKEVVEKIATRFFYKKGKWLRHKTVDAVLRDQRQLSQKRRASAKKRWQ